MTKTLIPTEMSKGQSDNTNTPQKKFDYTAIADRSVEITTVTQLVWLTGLRAHTFTTVKIHILLGK